MMMTLCTPDLVLCAAAAGENSSRPTKKLCIKRCIIVFWSFHRCGADRPQLWCGIKSLMLPRRLAFRKLLSTVLTTAALSAQSAPAIEVASRSAQEQLERALYGTGAPEMQSYQQQKHSDVRAERPSSNPFKAGREPLPRNPDNGRTLDILRYSSKY